MVFPFIEQLRAGAGWPARAAWRLVAALLLAPAAGWGADSVAADEDAAELEALSPEGIAGEILDRALEHCRNGDKAAAIAMFRAIKSQLEPPPPILRLIRDFEATGCNSSQPQPTSFKVQLGVGWDSNVSQGISARTLVVGAGPDAIELELDESYRRRASFFALSTIEYTTALPGLQGELRLAAGHRRNERLSALDLSTLGADLSREYAWGPGRLRGRLGLSEVWLGARHYQRAQELSVHWLAPQQQGVWLASLAASRVHYTTQPGQDAWQAEAGLLREQRLNASTAVFAGLAIQHDQALGSRPGGNRQGYELRAGGVWLAGGWRLRPELSYTDWRSRQAFAPGLLDARRHHRLVQFEVQAEKPLSATSSLVLEWRSRIARDTIPLYSFSAHSLGASWIGRF